MRSVVDRNVVMRRMTVLLVLISVRGRGDIHGHSAARRIMSIPIQMTSGIEPATFRLVAQCLNQLHHRVRD